MRRGRRCRYLVYRPPEQRPDHEHRGDSSDAPDNEGGPRRGGIEEDPSQYIGERTPGESGCSKQAENPAEHRWRYEALDQGGSGHIVEPITHSCHGLHAARGDHVRCQTSGEGPDTGRALLEMPAFQEGDQHRAESSAIDIVAEA